MCRKPARDQNCTLFFLRKDLSKNELGTSWFDWLASSRDLPVAGISGMHLHLSAGDLNPAPHAHMANTLDTEKMTMGFGPARNRNERWQNSSLKMSRGFRGTLVTYCHVTNYPKLTGFSIARFTISWFVEATRLGENISLVKLTQVLCCQGYRPRRCSKRQGCGQEASIPQHMTAEVKSQQGSCFLQSQENPTLHKSSLERHMASLCLYSHVLQESSGLKRWLSDYELILQRAALAEGRSLIPSFHIKEPTATL